MKIRPIEKMVKAEEALCIYETAGGDTWVGTGRCMYNIGNIGKSPQQTIKWLFGLDSKEIEEYDTEIDGFFPPDDDSADYLPEDDPLGVIVGDTFGTIAEPHIFGGVVYMLTTDRMAPLAGECNLAYRYDTIAKRVVVMRGMFAVASISVAPANASREFFGKFETMLKLIKLQSKG